MSGIILGSVLRGRTGRRQPDVDRQTHRMFLLPEILESILLQLPAITVLIRCRRVSKTWQALIDTSPSLRYYTSTGLDKQLQHRPLFYSLVPENTDDPSQPPKVVTPMAMEVLSSFWIKLMSKGYDIHLRAYQDNIFPRVAHVPYPEYISDASLSDTTNASASLEPQNIVAASLSNLSAIRRRVTESKEDRSRRRLKPEIQRLINQFAAITHRVPLLDPTLNVSNLSDMKVAERCEWGYIMRGDPVAAASEELPKVENVVGEQWVELMTKLVRNVYFRTQHSPDSTMSIQFPQRESLRIRYDHPFLLGVNNGSLLVYRISYNAGIDARSGRRWVYETTLFMGTYNCYYLRIRKYSSTMTFAVLGRV
ncbi:hypothetical protein TWF694_004338 [Orbilia ellipsospora]|uniref:F-box domain-containing protein n=1 Tax=Orbilia ellipsospora TaxID=2528407 RepID=A0AAV9WZY4_9PEZI